MKFHRNSLNYNRHVFAHLIFVILVFTLYLIKTLNLSKKSAKMNERYIHLQTLSI